MDFHPPFKASLAEAFPLCDNVNMKYFVFSIDDGTIYDKEVISLLNKYQMPATFNLNSELNNFTWYLGDKPITRLNLSDNINLYNGHEIASHSLTHPYLHECQDERVSYEVERDIENLENIFHREVVGFATPFETAGEREVDIIKRTTKAKYIRLSQLDESFKMPTDPYHIRCTSIDIERANVLIKNFINDENAELFVCVFHSYDLFTSSSIDRLENLLKILADNKENIKVIQLKEVLSLI